MIRVLPRVLAMTRLCRVLLAPPVASTTPVVLRREPRNLARCRVVSPLVLVCDPLVPLTLLETPAVCPPTTLAIGP